MDIETFRRIMDDSYQYIMIPSVKYERGIGTYASYDIAVFDILHRCVDDIVFDVTSDRELALKIIERFNRHQLSPINIKEVIIDMLE